MTTTGIGITCNDDETYKARIEQFAREQFAYAQSKEIEIKIEPVAFNGIDSHSGPLVILLNKTAKQLVTSLVKLCCEKECCYQILFISTEENLDCFPELKLLNELQNFLYLKAPFEIDDLEHNLQLLQEKQKPIKGDGVRHFLEEVIRRFFANKIGYPGAYKEVNDRLLGGESRNLEHDIWQQISLIDKKKVEFNQKFEEFFKLSEHISDYKTWLKWLYDLEREGLIQNYAEMICALTSTDITKLNVLIIDNNPESFMQDLLIFREQFKDRYDFFIKKDQLKELLAKLSDKKLKKQDIEITSLTVPDKSSTDKKDKKKLIDFDLILLDLHLGNHLRGQDFLKQLYCHYPEIPVFIVSSSEDFNTVRETLKGGADYYVPKSRLISLPHKINRYFTELGELIWLAKENNCGEEKSKKLRRNLIGNIRRIMFDNQTLWFGDKCYHMINHSFFHALNDWKIANQILPPIMQYLRDQEDAKKLTDEDIYCFCMAVWLHDIGHKGNEYYGEPHTVRDVHGLISAELIMKHPEHYGIYGYEGGNASPYRWATFRHPKTAPQLIRERFAMLAATSYMADVDKEGHDGIHRMTLLERIALICLYHKSNFPLDEEDVKQMTSKGKRIPLDCYEYFDRQTEPIHLKSICDLTHDENLMKLTALFRFIDGIDINRNRVGDETQESIKIETIERDLKQQLLRLKEEVNRLSDIYIRGSGKEKRFISLFFESVLKLIEGKKGMGKALMKEQQQFMDTINQAVPLDNYYTLIDYIQFISVQDGHFKLHNSISDMVIKPESSHHSGRIRFDIRYKSDKGKDHLDNNTITVKEWREPKGRTIRDHLLGKRKIIEGTEYRIENGYVRREMNNGETYLRDWFDLENSRITLCDPKGTKIFEEMKEKSGTE